MRQCGNKFFLKTPPFVQSNPKMGFFKVEKHPVVIGQSRLVGTPRCGVRTAQRAVPTIPGPPSLTDYT
jgi:hypothetical protein